VRRVQVVVEDPAQCGVAVGLIEGTGEFGRVRPEQVVAAEPAARQFGEQVGADQIVERWPDPTRRPADQARRGGRRHVRAGVQAEQPEQPLCRGGQRRVRQVERGPDGGLLVAVHLEGGQPVAGREPGRVVGDPFGVGQVRRRDPQRQRQVRA
jgi:hypothetical protein